jgi:DNA invertase Pin-like site-specific DNA recombinase
MRGSKIGNSGPLSPLSRSSSAEAPLSAGVTLPSDLSKSLQYLEDAQLERLREAVAAEINRRDQNSKKGQADATAASRGAPIREKSSATQEIPEGKANLIRASFKAGLKPATIARTFHVSQALVHRVIRSMENPRR